MFDCVLNTALHSERLPCFSKINRMLMVTNINTKKQNQSLVHFKNPRIPNRTSIYLHSFHTTFLLFKTFPIVELYVLLLDMPINISQILNL